MSNPIQALFALRGDLLTYHTLLKGEFDRELTRLEALSAEVSLKLGSLDTIEKAEAKAASIIEECELRAKAILEKEAAQAARDVEAEKRESLIQGRENLVRQMELETKSGWNKLQEAKNAHDVAMVKAQEDIAQQQASLNISAQQVASEREELASKARKLSAAVKSL